MFSERDYTRAPFRSRPPRQSSIIKALVIANIAVFVLQVLTAQRLTVMLSLSSPGIRNFEIWRIGTHMFAHGGIAHIFFNMWALYIFGQPLEERIGAGRFLHLYFVSGLVGGGIWLLFNWNSSIPVIGASGAVFGVMTAAAILFPNRMYMLLIPPIPMRLKTLAVLFAVIESISLLNQSGGRIAHLAHLGGMVGGYLYMRKSFPNLWGNGLMGLFRLFRKKNRDRTSGEGFRYVNRDDGGSDAVSAAEVDQILDKIGKHGIASLTRKERETLERARQRFRKY